MGLFDLVGAARGLVRSGVSATVVEPSELALARQRIPEHIIGLLWFLDGPLANFTQEPNFESSSVFDGVKLTMTFFGPSEPSAISPRFPVVAPDDIRSVAPLGYYPSYEGMSPQQRWLYLNWLTNIDAPTDIGYVFVFYYGLERHLFAGRADEAVNSIIRLRANHTHGSFTHYSSNALIAASLVANRPDWLMKFAQTIDSASDVSLSDVYLYAKYLHGFSLSAPETIALANRVGFTNRRYIKNEPVVFEAAVDQVLSEMYGESGLLLSDYAIDECSESKSPLFANYSLNRNQELLTVPSFNDVARFKDDVRDVLSSAHELVKQRLKEERAAKRRAEKESAG